MNRDELVRPEGGRVPPMSAEPVIQHSLRQGAKLCEQGELGRTLSGSRVSWLPEIQIGPFRIDADDATKHIALIGAPGSGKTVLMRMLMQSVLPTIGRPWKGRLSELDVRKTFILGIASTLRNAIGEHEVRNGLGRPSSQQGQNAAQKPQIRTRIVEEPLDAKSAKHRQWWLFSNRLILLGAAGLILAWTLAALGLGNLTVSGILITPLYVGLPLWCLVTLSAFLLGRRLWPKKRRVKEQVAPEPPPAPMSRPSNVAPSPPVYDGPLKWDGHRALIYDAKLEVIPELAGMGLSCPVHILNPFDERCAAWDMAADITEPAVAKQIAAIFIPDEKNSSQPFFKDSSRQLLEGVFISFILTQKNNWTFRDVLNATKSREALVGVLGATPYTSDLIGHYLNSDRETKSTLATLATKLGAFDVVAALWDSAEHKISLREWLDSESILVLGNDEAYRSTLGVINRVIFNRIVELLLARKSTTTGRTWFFLDEVKEAGELEALDRLMTKGRSFGAAVVLGFQNINGLYETFGENPAKSILGQCATKVFLRVDSPETAEWAQSVFGEYEATEIKQSATLGESESEGESFTSGRSSSHTETSGSSFSGLGANATRGTNQSSSESTSTSESKSTSSTSGTNRSLSKSAEVVKRSLVLASEFMHLPMTNRVNGLNGYISHHLGKARFRFSGFEHELLPASDTEERVRYRPSSQQFLRPWSEGEATRFIPKRTDVPPSATTSSSGSLVNETQPEPTKNLGQALAGLKSRQGRGRSLLPSSNPENGLVRES